MPRLKKKGPVTDIIVAEGSKDEEDAEEITEEVGEIDEEPLKQKEAIDEGSKNNATELKDELAAMKLQLQGVLEVLRGLTTPEVTSRRRVKVTPLQYTSLSHQYKEIEEERREQFFKR